MIINILVIKEEAQELAKYVKNLLNKMVQQCLNFTWRNSQTTEGSSYWGSPPGNNPIGSCIEGWVYKINGDNDYKELVAECDNEEAIELPKEKIGQFVDFKVIGSGNAILSIYCKYNPTLKQTYELKLGDY